MINENIFFNIVIAIALKQEDIISDWEWLQKNMLQILSSFDNEEDTTDFVLCKISSLVANNCAIDSLTVSGKKKHLRLINIDYISFI